MKLGYLGPHGTFSEKAAFMFKQEDTNLNMYRTIWEVLDAVNSSKIDAGVVPIENSIGGVVNVTIDSLVFDFDIFIQRQLILPIKHSLIAKKGADKNNFLKISSHSQGLAQCQEYLRKNYKNVNTTETTSTSRAIKEVSESKENIAAIGIQEAAEIYNLEVIDTDIQDDNDNYTCFVYVSKKEPKISLKNQITSIAFSTPNKPGELYKILDIFSIWGLNMTKIVSRPMRKKTGEYMFFIELEGNTDDKDLIDALTMVRRKCSFFKILGSYGYEVLN